MSTLLLTLFSEPFIRFATNRTEITMDKARREIFSFLTIKAIHEIFKEFIMISNTEMMKKVSLM